VGLLFPSGTTTMSTCPDPSPSSYTTASPVWIPAVPLRHVRGWRR